MGQRELYERVKSAREAAGLAIWHCARAMDWDKKQWIRLESGERKKFTVAELSAIAKIVGVTVSHLFGEQPIVVPGYRRRGRPFGTTKGEKVGLGE